MMGKKGALIIGAVVLVVAGLVSYSYFTFVSGASGKSTLSLSNYKLPTESGNSDAAATNEPKTEECPLSGEMLGKSLKAKWDLRRPLGIMVENQTQARPQSGLSSADVVYEAVAEGGITRFLAIFYCHDAPFVGPVRSARIYFLKTIQGYGDHPLYAHVGGANQEGPADALGEIEDIGWAGYNDLNEFSVPFPNFWRDYERLPNVATEHTMYTSTSKLWDYAKAKRDLTNVDSKGKAWNADFTAWKFKSDVPSASFGKATTISFQFWAASASDYAVVWTFDPATDSYKRTTAGTPHIDKNTGKQLTAKNVVVVFADEHPANDGYPGGQHILYDIIGTGDGILFQDGTATKITWHKKDEDTLMRFTDPTGKEVSFNRGETFVEILPTGNKVSY